MHNIHKNLTIALVGAVLSTISMGAALKDMVEFPAGNQARKSVAFPIKDGVFSVSMWVRPEVYPFMSPPAGMLLNAGSGYFNGFRLSMMPRKNEGAYVPQFEIGQPQRSLMLRTMTAVMEPGAWTHLVGTCDGKNAQFFVNGKKVAEGVCWAPYKDAWNVTFSDGKSWGLVPIPFSGDRVKLYHHVLTSQEIDVLAHETPFEGDCREAIALLKKIVRVGHVTSAEIKQVQSKVKLSPLARREFERAMACAYLYEHAYDKARAAYEKTMSEFGGSASEKAAKKDYRNLFASTLRETGYRKEALVFAEEDFAVLEAEGSAGRGVAALELAMLYRDNGEEAKAAALEKRIFANGGVERYPQLSTERGKTAFYTATQQRGARAGKGWEGACVTSFHVSPCGDDAACGDEAHPFRTLIRAREAVRQAKAKGGVTVWIHGGTYEMRETLALTAEDSGTPEAPIVWKAWKDEQPVLTGGWCVPELKDVTDAATLARLPVAARGKVKWCDVTAAGADVCEEVAPYGYYVHVPPALTEVYQNGTRLDPARYPNKGEWLRVTELVKDAKKNTRGIICDALKDTLAMWADEKHLQVTGYWRWFWADLSTAVTNLNRTTGEFQFDTMRCSAGGMKTNQTFFIYNALCAIDSPGEWFIDRDAGKLYVWPHEDGRPWWKRLFGGGSSMTVSSFSGDFLSMTNVHDVCVSGLTFIYGRRTAVQMASCHDVAFSGNVIRNFSGVGMYALNCRDITISENVFRTFGHGALQVSGGDRMTLTSSGIVITGNELSDVENRRLTYAPHLHLTGVGTEVSYNHFHDAPSSAMRLEGNDFLIISNLTEKVVQESDDQGGVDIYCNISYLGNWYCHNTWKDIGRVSDNLPIGQAGVRFDGNISGQTVYGNRFIRCGTSMFGGVQTCGGRLHVVDNNLFVDCNKGMSISIYPLHYWTNTIYKSLIGLAYSPKPDGIDIRRGVYAKRYPHAVNLWKTNQVNYLTRNITVGLTPLLVNPPEETFQCANMHFEKMPDLGKLERETIWARIPEESETGTRETPLFLRAKRNELAIGKP